MNNMPGMSVTSTDPFGNPCDTMGGMKGMSVMGQSMAAMTNHMCITPKRSPQPGDEERAKAVVDQVRAAIEKYQDYKKVRKDIAAVKTQIPVVYRDIVLRSLQAHGALGTSNEMPFAQMLLGASILGIADGPTEVHKVTVARQLLRDYQPSPDPLWPSEYLPSKLAAAHAKYPGASDRPGASK